MLKSRGSDTYSNKRTCIHKSVSVATISFTDLLHSSILYTSAIYLYDVHR